MGKRRQVAGTRRPGAQPDAVPLPPPVPPASLADLVTRAEEACAELRETIREAHGARSDLLQSVKEAKASTAQAIFTLIDKTVNDGLDRYKDALNRAMQDGRASVLRQFDRMCKTLLGAKTRSTTTNQELLATLELSAILEVIDERSVASPEAAILMLEMKADPAAINLDNMNRVLELLRPLVEEPVTDDTQDR